MVNVIMASCFTLGLSLAGSDGEWFPWPNIVGLGMLGIAAIMANVEERRGMERG